jgi:2-aminoethylphosphonate-pyruvate transaminase
MKENVTTAVILAAGLGSRLKDRTRYAPKGFIEVDGKSLIERSIESLLDSNISNIIIGTGYLHEQFDSLRKKYPVTTLRNADYSTTGSMYTLYALTELIQRPFLLLESDLLYDAVAFEHLLNDMRPDIILASGATGSGDEVFIQASSDDKLQHMSKDPLRLEHISGELVGITKLSINTLVKMCAFARAEFNNGNRMLNYEDALVGVATTHPIYVKVINDLVWCEIDDDNHLRRAVELIYPKLKKK